MNATVIIPWRPTPERLKNFEFVLKWWSRHFPEIPIQLVDSEHDRFNRGASRNTGYRQCRTDDVLIFCDADTIPEESSVREALFAARDNRLHLPYTTFHGLNSLGTRRALRGRPLAGLPANETHDHATGGVIILTPEAYSQTGGHPEFMGWGFEDTIFRIVCDAILGPSVKHTGTIYHLYHQPSMNIGSDEYLANKSVSDEYVAVEGNPEAIRELISRRSHAILRNTPEGR